MTATPETHAAGGSLLADLLRVAKEAAAAGAEVLAGATTLPSKWMPP